MCSLSSVAFTSRFALSAQAVIDCGDTWVHKQNFNGCSELGGASAHSSEK